MATFAAAAAVVMTCLVDSDASSCWVTAVAGCDEAFVSMLAEAALLMMASLTKEGATTASGTSSASGSGSDPASTAATSEAKLSLPFVSVRLKTDELRSTDSFAAAVLMALSETSKLSLIA